MEKAEAECSEVKANTKPRKLIRKAAAGQRKINRRRGELDLTHEILSSVNRKIVFRRESGDRRERANVHVKSC